MNTALNATENPARPSRLRGLGRGIAASSAVALMGIGTMSAADASAAGISHGVSYVNSHAAKPKPTDLPRTSLQLVIRNGKLAAS